MIIRLGLAVVFFQIVNAEGDSETRAPKIDDTTAVNDHDNLGETAKGPSRLTFAKHTPEIKAVSDASDTPLAEATTDLHLTTSNDDTPGATTVLFSDETPTDETITVGSDDDTKTTSVALNVNENIESTTTSSKLKFRANDEDESEPSEQSHRGISVSAQNDDIEDHQPLDLFKLKRGDLRRSQSNIWNWDFWCQLQPVVGNCNQRLSRYYYDSQLDQCMTFIYSGCGSNRNNFYSAVDCERRCKGATFMTVKESERRDPCELQPSSGLCMALLPRFYYDVNEFTCKPFLYGGCGGNDNRFESTRDCQTRCTKVKFGRN